METLLELERMQQDLDDAMKVRDEAEIAYKDAYEWYKSRLQVVTSMLTEQLEKIRDYKKQHNIQ